MKNIFVIILSFLLIISCNTTTVEKPKNFIDEDKMEDIMYDLALLEGIKTQSFSNLYKVPTTTQFLKTKYKIDSLTFVQNNKYYASDINNYKHLFDRVKKRLEAESKIIVAKDSIENIKAKQIQTGEPIQNKIEEPGIVK
jgi:hypothetical protein